MEKKDFLLANGTYNKKYHDVKNSKFLQSDFYDPKDIIQVKYEMLKEVKSGKTISVAAEEFGFSRTAFYSINKAFEKEGLKGLMPEKPGPKKPHKLTAEYQKFIDESILKNPNISSSKIARSLEKDKGIEISMRTVERYRAKKKPL